MYGQRGSICVGLGRYLLETICFKDRAIVHSNWSLSDSFKSLVASGIIYSVKLYCVRSVKSFLLRIPDL